MPITVSSLIRNRCSRVNSGLFTTSSESAFLWRISASCAACQKNRYGLMVVPSTATTIIQ